MKRFTCLLLTSSFLASSFLPGCTLAPSYHRPDLAVSDRWPVAPAAAAPATTSADTLPWRQVFVDERLQRVIARALDHNRDLRVAVLNIEKARAQYRIQRASLLPALDAGLSQTTVHTPQSTSTLPSGAAFTAQSDSATIGLSSYEIDLFGRVRSLNKAALETYLATAETRRATEISLIAQTASAWLGMAADQDLLELARQTLKTRQDSYDLTQKMFKLGSSSEVTVRQADILVQQARGDAANAEALVNQDRNALVLLTGSDVPDADLPAGLPDDGALLADLPVGLPSDVLTRRPDVMAAEHSLIAQNANIGAARAAFFPRISLTGSTGSTSTELDDLFKAHTGTWSFTPSITLPIFDGGANRANLKSSKVSRDIAVATYDKTVQTAFKEVADALAVRATIAERLDAQTTATQSATVAFTLAQARYKNGIDSYINLLDAQRTLYGSQQGLITIRLTRADNLVSLYKALGGGASPS